MSDLPDDGTIFRPRRRVAPVADEGEDETARSERNLTWSEPDDATRVSSRVGETLDDASPDDATRVSPRLAETQPDDDTSREPDVALTRRARRAAAARAESPARPRASTAIRSGRGTVIADLPWQREVDDAPRRTPSVPDALALRAGVPPIAEAPMIAERAEVASPRSREREVDYASSLRAQRAAAGRRLAWIIALGIGVVVAAAVALLLLVTL